MIVCLASNEKRSLSGLRRIAGRSRQDLATRPGGEVRPVSAAAVDVNPRVLVRFLFGPFEEPPRIHDGQIDAAVTLAIAKAIVPVGAMQRDVAIEVQHVRDLFDEGTGWRRRSYG